MRFMRFRRLHYGRKCCMDITQGNTVVRYSIVQKDYKYTEKKNIMWAWKQLSFHICIMSAFVWKKKYVVLVEAKIHFKIPWAWQSQSPISLKNVGNHLPFEQQKCVTQIMQRPTKRARGIKSVSGCGVTSQKYFVKRKPISNLKMNFNGFCWLMQDNWTERKIMVNFFGRRMSELTFNKCVKVKLSDVTSRGTKPRILYFIHHIFDLEEQKPIIQ